MWRLSRDKFLKCHRCGWTVSYPILRWVTHPSWLKYYLQQLRHYPVSTLWRFTKTVVGIAVIAFILTVGGSLLMNGAVTDGGGNLGAVGQDQPGGLGDSSTNNSTTGAMSDTPSESNPWGKGTIIVGVQNNVAPSRNFTEVVAAAIEYWEQHEEYGAYSVDFVLRPNTEQPDLIIRYNETIPCSYGASGCAPLLNSSVVAYPPETVHIRYNESDNYRTVRYTVIHEFGHVLGITHCEEPHWMMSYWTGGHGCENPTFDGPSVENQDLAWRDSNLTLYIDYSAVSEANRDETQEQVNHALAYFEEGRAEEFPGQVSFTRVDDPWKADIVITFASNRCEGDHVVCGSGGAARDFDNDGEFEYYTRGRFTVETGSDVDARGWYIGWGIAHQLAPGHIPPVFQDASYEERRSDWWN